jgi:hypothetical protein
MIGNFTQVAGDDADELAHRRGVATAMQMLSERPISPKDFLWLCAETAEAADAADRPKARAHSAPPRRRCAMKPAERRASDVAGIAV